MNVWIDFVSGNVKIIHYGKREITSMTRKGVKMDRQGCMFPPDNRIGKKGHGQTRIVDRAGAHGNAL